MSPNPVPSGITTVFKGLNLNMGAPPKTPPPPKPHGTPGTAETVLDTDSITTELYSPENENKLLYDQIHQLQNENKILKQNLKNMEKIYEDVPIPATEITDKSGNSLYTLCPFTSAHPKDAPLFNKSGQRIVGKKLFSSPKSKTGKRSRESPKTPSPRKTQKTQHSPGHKSKR